MYVTARGHQYALAGAALGVAGNVRQVPVQVRGHRLRLRFATAQCAQPDKTAADIRDGILSNHFVMQSQLVQFRPQFPVKRCQENQVRPQGQQCLVIRIKETTHLKTGRRLRRIGAISGHTDHAAAQAEGKHGFRDARRHGHHPPAGHRGVRPGFQVHEAFPHPVFHHKGCRERRKDDDRRYCNPLHYVYALWLILLLPGHYCTRNSPPGSSRIPSKQTGHFSALG